jgi:peptide/nickel transport system substrate-binding protein
VSSRPKSWRRPALAGIIVILLTGLVWGMATALAASGSPSGSPAAAPTAPPSDGKITLRVGWLADPDNLNPFLGTTSSAYTVWYMNYDPLVGINPADMTPSKEIGLASDWSSSADGKTWTFTIRPDVKWQDGQPLTAADIAFTINLIVDNQNATWISYLSTVSKATAVDDHTVRIDCNHAAPSMLVNLAAFPILPEHIWSKIPKQEVFNSLPNKPPLIGSGPFKCVEWKKSDYLVMEANKDYWRGPPHVDQVVFMMFTNPDTMGQEMKAGTIDACDGLLDAQMRMLDGTPGIETKAVMVNGYDELGFNCYTGPSGGNPVLKDYKFRQALQWAVDKQKLCDIAYGGMAKPADTVVTADYYHNPDWHWTPPADQAYTFDLEKAKAALDAAGYKDSDGDGIREDKQGKPIELRLWARTEYPQGVTCGKFMANWFREIGLKIAFTAIDDGALLDAQYKTVDGVFTPDYDMFEWGWYNDIDPSIELAYFTTGQINNWSDSAWSYAPYDELYKQQSTEMDQAKRLQMIYDLQKMIYEQSPYIPLAFSNDTEAWNTERWSDWVEMPANVGNVVFPPYGYETYYSVRPATSGHTTSQAGKTGVLVIIGVVVVVVLGILIYVFIKRRTESVNEPDEDALEE